jgi:hypothetical protein
LPACSIRRGDDASVLKKVELQLAVVEHLKRLPDLVEHPLGRWILVGRHQAQDHLVNALDVRKEKPNETREHGRRHVEVRIHAVDLQKKEMEPQGDLQDSSGWGLRPQTPAPAAG